MYTIFFLLSRSAPIIACTCSLFLSIEAWLLMPSMFASLTCLCQATCTRTIAPLFARLSAIDCSECRIERWNDYPPFIIAIPCARAAMSLVSLTDDELKAALFLFSPVVDSILNGVDVGVAQRRRPRCTVTKQNSKDSSSVSRIFSFLF